MWLDIAMGRNVFDSCSWCQRLTKLPILALPILLAGHARADVRRLSQPARGILDTLERTAARGSFRPRVGTIIGAQSGCTGSGAGSVRNPTCAACAFTICGTLVRLYLIA